MSGDNDEKEGCSLTVLILVIAAVICIVAGLELGI